MAKNIDLVTQLQQLTPEELAKVGNLINKFASRKDDETPTNKKPRKQHTKPASKSKTQTLDEIPIENDEPVGRPSTRKKILTGPNDRPQRGRMTGRGTTKVKGGKAKGSAGRTESVRLSGENRFLKMSERNQAKQDSLIDKKLWGSNQVTERRDPFEPVEAECDKCGKWFDVNPVLMRHDEELGWLYTCNGCNGRGH